MRIVAISSAVFILGLAAGCSQSEPEPAPIMPEPVYDKYGNEVASGGCSQVAGTADCLPPDDYRTPSTHRGGGGGGGGTPGTGGGTPGATGGATAGTP